MHITQCVLAFLSLYVGLAHSFTWEIVIRTSNRLEFFDINGTLTHIEIAASGYIETITYDPVHDRVLFADFHNIFSFKIASKTIETLVTITNGSISSMSYDPVTELLFWNEELKSIHSFSLKTGFNNRTNDKQLIYSHPAFCHMVTVDICGEFIHWISNDMNIQKSRFDGSEKENVTGVVSTPDCRIHIDQQTHKIYWYEDDSKSFKCADLNGKNTIDLNQIRPRFEVETHLFAFSKDHIYLAIRPTRGVTTTKCYIWKYPKNAPSDIDVLIESNLFVERDNYCFGIAVKYSIEDLTRGVQNCERVKSLLPNKSVTNVSSDVSLLCVHGTKVSGESRCECAQGYSGERCDILNLKFFLNFNLTFNLGFGIPLLDGHLKKVAETGGELSGASAIPVHSSP